MLLVLVRFGRNDKLGKYCYLQTALTKALFCERIQRRRAAFQMVLLLQCVAFPHSQMLQICQSKHHFLKVGILILEKKQRDQMHEVSVQRSDLFLCVCVCVNLSSQKHMNELTSKFRLPVDAKKQFCVTVKQKCLFVDQPTGLSLPAGTGTGLIVYNIPKK